MGNAVSGGGGLGPVVLSGTAANGDIIEATSATAAIWTVGGGVSGQYLCAPTSYAPGSIGSPTATTTSMAAFSTSLINTGSFVAPASGSVLVTVSWVGSSSASNPIAIGLVNHGGSTVQGNVAQFRESAINTAFMHSTQLLVTGLAAGSSFNFDLAGAIGGGATYTILALAQTAPTLVAGTNAGPVIMTVQAI